MKEYKQLTVNGKAIGRNYYGAFNANHLHAAGGYIGKMPQYWLKDGFAIRESELIKHFGLSQPFYIEPGENGFDEVYLSREFTLVYAESIGKKFYYQVVKAFDNMMLADKAPGCKQQFIGGRFTAINPAFEDDKKEPTSLAALESKVSELTKRMIMVEAGLSVLSEQKPVETKHGQIAQDFFDAFHEINRTAEGYELHNHSNFPGKELAINLNHAIDECRKTGIKLPSRKIIVRALVNDRSFVCNKVFNSRLTGKSVRCFLFNR